MPRAGFSVRTVGGIAVVVTPSEIDIANADGLRSALDDAAACGGALVVDMSGTEFCDLSGIRVLVHAREDVEAAAGALLLVRPDDAVRRALVVTGVAGLFRIVPSLDAAFAALVAGLPAVSGV